MRTQTETTTETTTETRAKTIRSMMGATVAAPDLATAALIVIDAQMAYGPTGALPLVGMEAALARVADLLTAMRAAGGLVIHVAHHGGAGGPFDPAGPGVAFLDAATPRPGEAIVVKRLADSFAGTDLAGLLGDWGGRTLILAGFMTHNCIAATVVGAVDHGYGVVIAGDATATRDLPDPLGGETLSAAAIQRAVLAGLSDAMADVLPVAALVR